MCRKKNSDQLMLKIIKTCMRRVTTEFSKRGQTSLVNQLSSDAPMDGRRSREGVLLMIVKLDYQFINVETVNTFQRLATASGPAMHAG
jgi:hypothetical protein